MTLLNRFLALLERYVQKLRVRGDRAIGCCPFHKDRKPSFSADLAKGVFYCFSCGAGGGVRDFAQRVGEDWTSAPETRQQHAHRVALAAAKENYQSWEHRTFNRLLDERKQTEAAQKPLISLYKKIEGFGNEFPAWLIKKISSNYDQLARIELKLDYLTLREYEKVRLRWWEEETERVAA